MSGGMMKVVVADRCAAAQNSQRLRCPRLPSLLTMPEDWRQSLVSLCRCGLRHKFLHISDHFQLVPDLGQASCPRVPSSQLRYQAYICL
jgi:hypothetical protein